VQKALALVPASQVLNAFAKTICIQADIDTLYPQVEKTLLEIQLGAE